MISSDEMYIASSESLSIQPLNSLLLSSRQSETIINHTSMEINKSYLRNKLSIIDRVSKSLSSIFLKKTGNVVKSPNIFLIRHPETF